MELKQFYTPNDEGIIADFDAVSVQTAIDAAARAALNKVVIPRVNARNGSTVWEFDRTVRIPSDMTIVLDNCFIRLADNTFCNVFVNSNHDTPLGKTLEGEQKNIRIEGIGNATIDGGNYNGLSERNSLKDGMPYIGVNTPLLFTNISNFDIGGFKVTNQRWWGMTYIYSRNGHIHDIEFQADKSGVGEDGERRPDLRPNSWGSFYIRNADGVDLRCGCNNILIENITGFTQDDTVALTALSGVNMEQRWSVDGKVSDICRVLIRNVMSETVCANIRLTCGDRNKIYDVSIDGVVDATYDQCYYNGATIRIDNLNYGKICGAEHGDMYNISINNILSRAKSAVEILKTVKNLRVSNVYLGTDITVGIKNHNVESNITFDTKIENASFDGIYSDFAEGYAVMLNNCEMINTKVTDITPNLKATVNGEDII